MTEAKGVEMTNNDSFAKVSLTEFGKIGRFFKGFVSTEKRGRLHF
jgi:hypothetical protein